jgi:hypothetical protein
MKAIMNLQAKKLEIVQLILNTEKPSLLKKVEDVFKKEQATDWWYAISDEERAEIEQGLAEADRGEVIPHEEVMAKYKKWL